MTQPETPPRSSNPGAPAPLLPEHVSLRDAAHALGLSVKTLSNWAWAGR